MRVWDLPVEKLCRQHLLGEHRELHAIWTILTLDKKGYSNHPETKRWKGKLTALYKRHDEEVKEMKKRNYRHNSLLDKKLAIGKIKQDILITTIKKQKEILINKYCGCYNQN